MGATPTYALPYPELDDPDNVPTDMHELADAVEAKLVAEAGARQAVDGRVTAETNARIADVNAEETARIAAVNAEAGARAGADAALADRATALEARNRTIGGIVLLDFVDGSARLNYAAPVAATIGAVVNGSDSRTWNCWYGTHTIDANGIGIYAWNGAVNQPLNLAGVRISWVAVVQ